MMRYRNMVLLLGALLLIASLDAVPDPPAINPHTTNVIASQISSAAGHLAERRLHCDWICASSRGFHARWSEFTSAIEPALPGAPTTITAHAADPSPPLQTPANLNFQF